MKRLFTTIAASALAAASFAAPAQEDALQDLPGYVDFGHLQSVYGEPKVEIALAEPLLGFFQAMAAEEDPETAEMFGKLKGIRVQIFDVGDDPTAALETMRDVSSRLQSDAWAPIVKVRDEGERVDIFMKMAGENVEGLTVMVTGDENEAVFVNIIGSIQPDELSRVMDSVNVDGIEIE